MPQIVLLEVSKQEITMAAKKSKKAKKRIRRGHIEDTHTVRELRDEGESVLRFSQTDKRLIGVGIGAALGGMIGMAIADNPRGVSRLVEEMPGYLKKAYASNPESFDGLLQAMGVSLERTGGVPVVDESMLYGIFSTKQPPPDPMPVDATWVDRRDVAILRTAKDGAQHAFALAFDGPVKSACGEVEDVATSPLNKATGLCQKCLKILLEAGYSPPRVGAPPGTVDAEFADDPSRPQSPPPSATARPKRSRRKAAAASE